MIYHTFSLLLLLCVGEALRISSARLAPVQDSSQFLADTQHNNESFTFGFIRTDTFDRLNYAWIRAQVLPIGVCFKEGIYGGSAEYAQATMGSSYLWKTAHFYNSSDCSGDFLTSVFQMPVVETLELVEHIVRVVPNIEAALALDSRFTSGGLVISSYVSSDGCTGKTAQYDLFSADDCNAYDYPVRADGKFQCDTAAELMTFHASHEPRDVDQAYPDCKTADLIIEQPLLCSDQGTEGVGQPFFQSVRCIRDMPVTFRD